MAARVLSIRDLTPKQAQYSLLVSALPGRGIQTIGVLLLDPARYTCGFRLRRDWERLGDEEDVEVLPNLRMIWRHRLTVAAEQRSSNGLKLRRLSVSASRIERPSAYGISTKL